MLRSTTNSGSAEIKRALAYQRKKLKIRLYRERREVLLPLGPPCVYCDRKIWNSDQAVMHEWLIKRSALPLSQQHLIMHEYNCVMMDRDCHAEHGQTKEAKLRSAKAQYKRYSRKSIVQWVETLGLRQYVEIPEEET